MGSLGNSKTLEVPYINPKDCSLGFCSWHCPQWCYINLPPPPPLQFPNDDENYDNSSNFSPLVIAIIGILASAFLLVSYYLIISKFCKNTTPRSVRDDSVPPSEFHEEIHDTMVHVPWHVVSTGLDEALIKSIAVCKYKKGDGLVEGTECSVCLTEFQEDESLRLLPKCSHAFHIDCIDTWLKSHSNCPLCRALIISPGSSLPPPIPTLVQTDPHTRNESLPCLNPGTVLELEPRAREEVNPRIVGFAKNSVRAMSDLGGMERLESIIEIRDEDEKRKRVRRSMSMDYLCQNRVSIADVLRTEEEHDAVVQTRKRQRVLHYVMSPVAMKRSFSRGGFLCVGHGKSQINAIIPF